MTDMDTLMENETPDEPDESLVEETGEPEEPGIRAVTLEELTAFGEAVYGPQWKTSLARRLGWADKSGHLARIYQKKRPVPVRTYFATAEGGQQLIPFAQALRIIAEERVQAIVAITQQISGPAPGEF